MAYAPLKGLTLAVVSIALSMAVFMQVLDSTIANVALPTITGNLGAATSQGTWVITAFAVANAISVPLTGWLAQRYGEVKVFVLSTLSFVMASFLCGIAPSLELLVFFRVLQGAVAGPILPLSQSLMMSVYPPEKRPMALAIWSMMIVVAPILGPILGGVISDNWHWGWIFFINIPIGMVAGWVAWQQLKHRETPIIHKPIDSIGLSLMVIGIGSLQMMLDRGHELDWFSSNEIIVLAILTVICLSYFIIWECYAKFPIVDLKLFRDRNFTVGVLTLSTAFMTYMSAIVLLPLVLQTELGYTATWSGLATAPIGFFPVLLSPLIGKFGYRLDMRVLVTISFTIYAGCFFWRSHFNAEMDFMNVFWPQFIQGIGMAMFFMPLTQITLSRMSGSQIAEAASIANFIRLLGGSMGTSMVNVLWDKREALHHTQLVEAINPYNELSKQSIQGMTQMGMNDLQPLQALEQTITQQARIMGANDLFWLYGVIFLALIAMVWFARAPFAQSGDHGGGH